MPFKSEEERKAYNKEQMRQRRARAKAEQEGASGTAASSAAVAVPPPPKAAVPPPAAKEKPSPGPAIPAKEDEKDDQPVNKPRMSEILPPMEIVERTEERLATKGWCLWECKNLGPKPEIIAVVRDESITGYPPGYPVYTEYELGKMGDMNPREMVLVHQAKRIMQTKLL